VLLLLLLLLLLLMVVVVLVVSPDQLYFVYPVTFEDLTPRGTRTMVMMMPMTVTARTPLMMMLVMLVVMTCLSPLVRRVGHSIRRVLVAAALGGVGPVRGVGVGDTPSGGVGQAANVRGGGGRWGSWTRWWWWWWWWWWPVQIVLMSTVLHVDDVADDDNDDDKTDNDNDEDDGGAWLTSGPMPLDEGGVLRELQRCLDRQADLQDQLAAMLEQRQLPDRWWLKGAGGGGVGWGATVAESAKAKLCMSRSSTESQQENAVVVTPYHTLLEWERLRVRT
jgi:hypothetical protein